jgi:hypothetical protein
MLLVLQFPIIDSRPFVSQAIVNPAPDWHTPEPDQDFVRFFGSIRQRPRGGSPYWHDELYFCASHGALKFPGFSGRSSVTGLGRYMAFRRVLNDGFGVVRCEIGLNFIARQLSPAACLDVLKEFLDMPCSVRLLDGTTVQRALVKQGSSLCRLFEAATREKGAQPRTDLVEVGKPCLLVEYSAAELSGVPNIIGSQLAEQGIGYGHISHVGIEVSAWFVKADERPDLRDTRITLLRLHAEHQALRRVARGLASQKIVFKAQSSEAAELKGFISRTLEHLTKPKRFGIAQQRFLELMNVYDRVAARDDIPLVVGNLARFSSQLGLNLQKYLEGALSGPLPTAPNLNGKPVPSKSNTTSAD